ncbi:hypothetical protein GGR50DRAFT_649095 [Xylaria sp. CBS 124048]|nr:hypothetical protein GGR50DRAFT_649095 [Xylaria sp. CBS 124048]
MATEQNPETRPNGPSRGRGQRGRSGRPSRSRGGRQGNSQLSESHNESQRTGATVPAPVAGPTASQGSRTRGRGRGGARASRRGRAPTVNASRTVMAPTRTFGGHLTTTERESDNRQNGEVPTALNPSASTFVPGQQFASPTPEVARRAPPRTTPRTTPKPARQTSRSTAPDLPTRIHEDINNRQYECVICTNEVLRNSRVWSCSICWTVTHMSCVKKWFTNRIIPSGQEQREQSWRCPGCNSTMIDEPGVYHCWCGKEIDPTSGAGSPPHSCGQTCSKPRGTCPHPCSLQCHAGPCPPCPLMGPSQSCFCGKNVSNKRCIQTDYTNGWSCNEICGDLLACGEHTCERTCHSGLCGSCETPVVSRCYCGGESKEIPCDELGDKLESYDYGQTRRGDDTQEHEAQDGIGTWFVGSFRCGHTCSRMFDCGKHSCQRPCHPQDEGPAHCPFSPDVITHCPCGATSVTDIAAPRESCLDPIPNCGKVCNKPLSCGHLCQENCHAGPCSECTQEIDINCRCGRTTTSVVCSKKDLHDPTCEKICRVQLNCGRHEHGVRCCPAEKIAIERVISKRRNWGSVTLNEEFEAEHICIRACDRPLECGQHRCRKLCHRGSCPSCLEAIFEEISCNCGRTVLHPPQPCGTRPPECRFDCTRPRLCGHPQVNHTCHPDDVACPKCPFLVEKKCICGKKTLKNQPCWFEEPRCGLPCNKKLKCGTHSCKKLCHGPGACEDEALSGSHCEQPCGKARSCGHIDSEQCHAPYPCKEDKPCQAKTFVTCECQHRKQEVKCSATKAQPTPQRPLLKCDDECLRLQRNARLAQALDINPQSHTDNHVPYSNATLKLYRVDPQWAHTYEREIRVFAGDRAEKRLRFKPMKAQQRAFIHSLAEDFGLDSESSDPEPHRHVCLFKTPRFVSAPMKTLAQSALIRASQDPLTQQAPLVDKEIVMPYNALLLTNPQFGLTVEAIDTALRKEYTAYPTIKFVTSFLPSEEVVIKGSGVWTPQMLENSLMALKPTLKQTVKRLKLAEDVFLCSVDESLNVLRREESRAPGEGRWSAVVGRSKDEPKPARALPLRSNFVALKKEPKKKIEDDPVEDDWETAAQKLDEVGETDEAAGSETV